MHVVCVKVREVGMDQIMRILEGLGKKMGFHSQNIWNPLKGFKQAVTRTDLHLQRSLWLLCGQGT